MSRPLEDYGLIGDGQSAALVSRDASIDWLCWPRFDDDACFAALLGRSEHGNWSIMPVAEPGELKRRYCDDTLVLETDFETQDGAVRIIDFMPLRKRFPSLVRIVVGLRGTVPMRSTLRLRFDYGLVPPWLSSEAGGVVARVGPDLIAVRAPMQLTIRDDAIEAQFNIGAGERLAFVMSYGPSHLPPPEPIDAEGALSATLRFWRRWIGHFDDSSSAWPQATRRSLLTLKALCHGPSGGLIAAPTTSLPEVPGGDMNWDYRYCWLRDASFALGALLRAGFHEEALGWRDWLLRAIAGSPEHVRIMYRVDGSRHAEERVVGSLPGYRSATPVRVGNAASTQHQIDALGEVIQCLALARRGGIPPSQREAEVATRIVLHLEQVWQSGGSGIWESRGTPRQYTYSKVMVWAALNSFIATLADAATLDAVTRARLVALRETVRQEVLCEGWSAGLGSFVQTYGGQAIDASLLRLPAVGFIAATEPRMASTIARVERELSEGGLVRRLKAPVDAPAEGSFLACSCWLADCMSMQGRHDEALAQFERVLAVRNDLGLLAEEYNLPGRHLSGNFPQALSHLALVDTALRLTSSAAGRPGG
ncbi:glycoside hydrolase family 15 protein [Caballeronia sp. LZ034LL]|uniref:glycoside hydrolase family 15 protein n=1 Tax=Caballeronia sp. LZ034LL TaxID=3038567 RepID=UPI00285BE123|nr:glycoside hydrolase family 15 protein [Caballeronia sp. LZ034LL]MDR5836533.1 glycoside hydrolase family 15 protein [Caballeronia sp. LZ034LL]